MSDDLVAAATRWLEEDPDPDTRAELSALIDARDLVALRDRFGARLQFGTAGLRGELGTGPNRMNRVIVRRAAAGLARYLLDRVPGAAEAGVVIGCDARHKSEVFAEDSAAMFAGMGVRALLLPPRLPTPLLAFAIRHLGCAAGVMVTASHNPPADNGYKVYLGDGAQIVPPADADISAAIDAVGALASIPIAALDSPLVTRIGSEIADAFQKAEVGLSLVPTARDVSVVYTAMHGVGRDQAVGVWQRAGFPPMHLVAAQADPDPDFPTVAFPNPEEPGALDLALADAARVHPDVLIANDPDADRLGAAIPDGAGGYRPLRGDEIGVLLADHVLRHTSGSDRLVATTVVSSTMLSKMAAAAGVHYAETLTGFKWIARAALDRPGTRFAFGYEEALGYLVGDVVRDKDGISAAMTLAEVAALAKAEGVSLQDRLDALAFAHGLHATDQWSVRLEGAEGQARIASVMEGLRRDPPGERAEPEGLPPADIVMLRIGADRVVVRPSGTEPKIKMYFEVVIPVAASLADARAAARTRLAELRSVLAAATGLSPR
ncbi:MAG TPA: phospho-sugar mutase [Acidimicrobiales bacterium]|nr:phospho-sugar mutase [Acidimicrobiales bacterium]